MSKTKCWFDADMGSDDRLAILMALGSDQFQPLGLSTVFGNVSVKTATENACDTLSAFGYDNIPIFKGASLPLNRILPIGDNAYGEDGTGGVRFTDMYSWMVTPYDQRADIALMDAVFNQQDKVTIFATGPLTNIAEIVQNLQGDRIRFDEFKEKTKLIIMGGSHAPGPHPNPPQRRGNITLHAEFNMHMDPNAAQIVFDSGLDCHLVTMDATQHTDFTPERQALLKQRIPGILGDKLVDMMRVVEDLDVGKFGAKGPFIHDPQVVVYALHPEAYLAARYERNGIFVEKTDPPRDWNPDSHYGELSIEPRSGSRITFVDDIAASPDEIFSHILDNVAKTAPRYQP